MRVLTLGSFDLFHTGHVNLLARCREIAGAGVVAVGLNTDDFIECYKGQPPVITFADRLAVVAACAHVDEVMPNAQADGSAMDVIEKAHPAVIVVGSDWQSKDYPKQLGVTWDWLDDCGVEVRFVPYTPHISSSQIRARL